MAKKDIYKIDNYFITIGLIFFVFGFLSVLFDPRTYNEVVILKRGASLASGGHVENYTYDDKRGRSLEEIRIASNADAVTEVKFPWIRAIIGLNGILIFTIGVYYRKRENKIIAIWNALERSGEARVDELALSLGLDRNFVITHLKEINAQQCSYFVWDQSKDKIVDSRLKTEFLIVVDCKSCGSKLNEKLSIDVLSTPKCEYCGNPVASSDDLNQMKKELLANRDAIKKADQKNFSAGIFVTLLIFFWPAAIYYIIKNKS